MVGALYLPYLSAAIFNTELSNLNKLFNEHVKNM